MRGRQLAERAVGERHSTPEPCEARARAGESVEVAVAGEQPCPVVGEQQRLRVAAVPERRIEEESGPWLEEAQRLAQEDRIMTPAHARPAPARRRPGLAASAPGRRHPAGLRPMASSTASTRSRRCGTGRAGSATVRTAPPHPYATRSPTAPRRVAARAGNPRAA